MDAQCYAACMAHDPSASNCVPNRILFLVTNCFWMAQFHRQRTFAFPVLRLSRSSSSCKVSSKFSIVSISVTRSIKGLNSESPELQNAWGPFIWCGSPNFSRKHWRNHSSYRRHCGVPERALWCGYSQNGTLEQFPVRSAAYRPSEIGGREERSEVPWMRRANIILQFMS